jgi:hypothetical protein
MPMIVIPGLIAASSASFSRRVRGVTASFVCRQRSAVMASSVFATSGIPSKS